MEYREWAQEYREQESILKERIEQLKKQRSIIKSTEERKSLEQRIYALYGMYIDCRQIGNLLSGRAMEDEKEELRRA